ncbi:hypothetical protein JKP88DRAFT_278654 [Tribonema minus]|uniref:SMP domain-containing protein n=1 Tax=Tribonema minus TaxID=303371 RepID=A0A835YUJ9_9STRA|nr:hypothetical protein JKP88DRAFT_278654 [Tribonema minus]
MSHPGSTTTITTFSVHYRKRPVALTAKGKGGGGKPTPITPADASRIQSAEAQKSGGKVAQDSWASRAQSAAARNANKGDNNKGVGSFGSIGAQEQKLLEAVAPEYAV